ncbi:MAG TPA: TatD family hydrolase [Acidimicrobiales bacterium]|nr:TatD family hydrolase [Acidimicrobiales bacterium]
MSPTGHSSSDARSDPAPASGWIDSHCHLQDRYRPSGTDVVEALGEAVAAGVRGLVCVGTDAESSQQALDLVRQVRAQQDRVGGVAPEHPDPSSFGCWATVGLHPHEASHGLTDVSGVLGRAVRDDPGLVVAVGECGLDYHYDHSPRPVQRAMFEAQAALATEFDLALVVHSRDAWDDTIEILRAAGPPPRTVLHCFTGGPAEARRCLDLGAYLSFSGIVTFNGAHDVRDAAVLCPLDRLLVETDAPFLAPVPHRGKPNHPAWVVYVGQAVAALKGLTPEALAEATSSATRAAFAVT